MTSRENASNDIAASSMWPGSSAAQSRRLAATWPAGCQLTRCFSSETAFSAYARVCSAAASASALAACALAASLRAVAAVSTYHHGAACSDFISVVQHGSPLYLNHHGA